MPHHAVCFILSLFIIYKKRKKIPPNIVSIPFFIQRKNLRSLHPISLQKKFKYKIWLGPFAAISSRQ